MGDHVENTVPEPGAPSAGDNLGAASHGPSEGNGAAAAAEQPLAAEAQPQQLSKNQLKKLKRRQQNDERKRLKKEQEKAKRKEAMAEKKAKIRESVSAMTDEEFAAWRAERAEKVASRAKEKEERKARLKEALESGQRIIVDMEFENLMKESELRSLIQQISYLYSANTKAAIPAHLILTGVKGKIKETMEHQANGFKNWMITSTDQSYLDHFADKKEDLVYLTADSPNELDQLDPSKAYIVGGLVDRNRHKNICFNKATEQGVATARLPLGEHIKLASSQVMCTNHVVEIMLKWQELKDWGAAFNAVIPTRKRKDHDGEQQEGEKKPAAGEGGDA